jgi:hypothetical protein
LSPPLLVQRSMCNWADLSFLFVANLPPVRNNVFPPPLLGLRSMV